MNKMIGQVFLICFIVICCTTPDNTKQKLSLPENKSVEVELSIAHGDDGLCFYTNCVNDEVSVIFRNRTDSAIRMYQDWNMWGYFNINFEIETPDSVYKIFRTSKGWDKNFPSYYKIDPTESIVFNYNLKSLICNEGYKRSTTRTANPEWVGLPEKKYDSAKIRVVYKLFNGVELMIYDTTYSGYGTIKRSFPAELSSKQYNIHIR